MMESGYEAKQCDGRKKNGEFVIIDGYSLIFRAYYAMPSLFSREGEPTGAVYGFAGMLIGILERHRDALVAVAYDRKEKTFRHDLFPAYKGTRKETDEDLIAQFPVVRELLEAMGIPVVEKAGFEADDIIGSLCKQAVDSGMEAHVYTGDRDALQLVQYGIQVHITIKGVSKTELYDEATVLEKMGVSSAQVVDYKSLRGDVSDNIPGAKGVGDKTAIKLLSEYGSTENILLHKDRLLPARVAKMISENEEMIRLSKILATVRLDVPIRLEDVVAHEADRSRIKHLLDRLGFASLSKKWMSFGGEQNPPENGKVISLSKESGASVHEQNPPENGEGVLPSDVEELVMPSEVERFDFKSEFFFGFLPEDSEGKRIYFSDGEQIHILSRRDELLRYRSVLEDPSIGKRLFSSKEFHLLCFEMGISLRGVISDAVIAAYLLNPARKSYHLHDLANEIGYSIEPSEAGRQMQFFGEESDRKSGYEAAAVTANLIRYLDQRIEREGHTDLYRKMEIPLVKVLADIEYTGFPFDREVLKQIDREISLKISDLEQKIHALAGEPFNISSPKQLGVILFEKMKLPFAKKNKTGYVTDRDVLEKLGEHAEIARLVVEFRSYSKLKSTYIDSLSELDRDGRIHTSLNQTIAVTGRLSSTEPNLQNIPIRLEEGRSIRKAFHAEEGCVLLDADYSQIELKVLAHMSGDQRLIEAFEHQMDIHALTASEVFGVPVEEVTSRQRSHAKEVNFGILYGMGDFGLSESLKIPVFEARHYIERYFETYVSVQPFMDDIVERCKKTGYVETMFGRRRYIPELRAKNKMVQAHGARMARNTVIQGTAADIIKIAMVKLYEELYRGNFRAKMILQIHDELILNVPTEELEDVKMLLKTCMEEAVSLSVPLKVDMQTAKTWYDAK